MSADRSECGRILSKMLDWDGFKISKAPDGGMLIEGGGHTYNAFYGDPGWALLEAYVYIESLIRARKLETENERRI